MAAIIIGAIVSLLIFFFEQWWKNKHPAETDPAGAKESFVSKVNAKWRFKLVPKAKRTAWAAKLFDKFVANYNATPKDVADSVYTRQGARALAERCAEGLTLESHER